MKFQDEEKLEMAEDLLELWLTFLESDREAPHKEPTFKEFMMWMEYQVVEARKPEVQSEHESPDEPKS